MGDAVFDLFGNPVRPGKGERGRPSFEVTERNRNKVKLLLAMGWANERVAGAIGCSLATLKRYFRAELAERQVMRDRLDAERMMVMAEAAMSGVIGASRVLQDMIDRNDRMQAERAVAEKTPVAKPQAADRLGKKAMVRAQAHDAEAELMLELEREAAGHVRN
ncbi:hypothetical protein [Rhodobacter capsulatus]|jgi:hypothetical protein|uniref:Uncharacterized protein n=1 Tax=Rhodobacter phage RcapNL TaxID=1131316 RepID=H6WBK6_9CAUD|nr:hypothetical protein [Rhodobacter capsulatus]YP_007518385.1 hypothetical protein I920_gp03 [Rhodobacter phage RcapNL]AFK66510.1 hypothetical protein RHZG_00003 [Rhodobacter phage RcNL1]AFA44843.1 hypothetical protein RcapNL_0003 [Rhodobacter phage RcapNL]ETD02732.1 resolvase [Rhodobacter capsulatus DE442]ETD78889.1 resolvase [Rhodobacter capsulatus R121]ETE54868.1 resolvase [Rhodobacter capsulatus Y262]